MRANSHAGSWWFPQDSIFPVVSSHLHPLKLHSRGLLARGIMSAVVLHFVVFGAWIVQRGLETGELPMPPQVVPEGKFELRDILQPPPIAPGESEVQMEAAVRPEIPDAAGVPEPVADFQAPEVDYLSNKAWVDDQPSTGIDDQAVPNSTLVIDPNAVREEVPDSGTFIAVEEEPYPIRNPAPVYPEMARAAEVEGLVTLRVLVNKEGRVERAFVISGHPMLDEAALAAVRNWVFRPAMQQHRPVMVWVTQPIRFVLH